MLKQYQSQIEKNKIKNPSAFRNSLETFLTNLDNEVSLVDLGNPDILLLKSKNRFLASIETKNFDCDLGNLNGKSLSLIKDNNNHIITNFREIDIYKEGQLVCSLSFLDEKGEVSNKTSLIPSSLYAGDKAIEMLQKSLEDFKSKPLICSKPSDLAVVLAGKTRTLKEIICSCLNEVKKSREFTKLEQEFEAYKNLIPDLDPSRFSDFYAQTMTYGLFVVHYLKSVSKIGSAFLDEAFSILSSKNIDERINNIYEEIKMILLQIDLNSEAWTSTNDIAIHFYQTFLEHYDLKLRKDFGAWYTPKYLVDYQVKATNQLLKYIGFSKGFADDINIIDPAMGTCNYLNSIIEETYKDYQHNNALWNTLVNTNLIPNIYGFEILMTPFIIAQMNLFETLRKTGFHFNSSSPSFNLFLANSLDPPKNGNLNFQYSDYLNEINNMSKKVLDIKNKRFACVIGSPPYNGQSIQRSEYINDLMLDYKPNKMVGDALNDDYLKFIRIGQNFIKQNGKGVVSYITNNSFLKNIAFDKVRESLLKSFDEIYIVNLHGDQKEDENLLGNSLGVAFLFLVKKEDSKNKLADVFYCEVLGSKEKKKSFCLNHDFNLHSKNGFKHLSFKGDPDFLFIPKSDSRDKYFHNSFSLEDLFDTRSYGIKTGNNALYIKATPDFDIKEKGSAIEYSHNPMDNQYLYWCDSLQGKAKKITQLKQVPDNFYLVFTSSVRDANDFSHIFVSSKYCDSTFFSGKANPYFAPVYLDIHKHNLKDDCFNQFKKIDSKVSPEDVVDYVYGVLNDQSYLKEFNQLLKLSQPRVPYPISKDIMHHYIQLGNSLRKIHLSLKPTGDLPLVKDVFFDTAQVKTSIDISRVNFDIDRIQINESQYFLASKSVWEYRVGAFRPARDWLENRMGQALTFKDVECYVNILAVIKETLRLTGSNLLSLDEEEKETLF